MKQKPYSRRKRTTTKSVLRLPDLDRAKAAVLNSLTSLDAQRGYRHAIDEELKAYRANQVVPTPDALWASLFVLLGSESKHSQDLE